MCGNSQEEDVDDDNNEIGASDSDMDFDEVDIDNSQPSFKIVSLAEVVKLMNDEIRQAKDVVQLSSTATRMLLNHFKWDKEKLYDAYYSSDVEQLFEAAQIDSLNQTRESGRVPSGCDQDCQICFTQRPPYIMSRMDCGHQFCLQCWDDYLTSKIKDEGTCQSIPCPEPECRVILDDRSVIGLLTDESVKTKYEQLMTDSFVQCNKMLRWCPGAGCTNIIFKQSFDLKPVVCTCETELCFKCGEPWHAPVKCEVLKEWLKSSATDKCTNQWMVANTKNCPRCGASIEKNGGCVHMTCRNVSCSHSFCWICLGDWGNNHSYQCNRFDEDQAKTIESARTAMARLIHYQKRYTAHEEGLKFAKILHDLLAEKHSSLNTLQTKLEVPWNDAQFLEKGIDTLCRCRKTLMYSYVFAHSLEKTGQKEIFEDNQSFLETVTENLSEILEEEIRSQKSFNEFRQTVLDKTKYCETRRLKLLEHVEEGYENCWWTSSTE